MTVVAYKANLRGLHASQRARNRRTKMEPGRRAYLCCEEMCVDRLVSDPENIFTVQNWASPIFGGKGGWSDPVPSPPPPQKDLWGPHFEDAHCSNTSANGRGQDAHRLLDALGGVDDLVEPRGGPVAPHKPPPGRGFLIRGESTDHRVFWGGPILDGFKKSTNIGQTTTSTTASPGGERSR